MNIHQVLTLGQSLDRVQKDSYTDLISNLPNMKAALLNIDSALAAGTAFALMMIDGDNIRAYNNINYAAGDEMIRQMISVISQHLRPEDFIARWRVGDEFMVVLPGASCEEAFGVGERCRIAIREASGNWKFPVTISIGISGFPLHGMDAASLIDAAEAANKRAKDAGKDRVVILS